MSVLSTNRAQHRTVVVALGAVALGVLVILATRAQAAGPHATPWLTALDVAVGLAFVAAAVIARGPLAERALVAGVGVAWLVGSFVPTGRSLHQGVLAVALIAFPAGRVRGWMSWLLAVLAVPVALGLMPQLGVAMLFAAVALLVAAGRDRAAALYPRGAAAAVATVLAVSWSAARLRLAAFDPTLALVAYQTMLLFVALTFPFAARTVIRARESLADEILSDDSLEGLHGLAAVLGPALGDPDLRIYRWDEAQSAFVDGQGRQIATDDQHRQWLRVDEGDDRIAVVAHRSPTLDDPPTAAAVRSTVRLAVTRLRLQEEQQRQLRDLEAARARLVAAADQARQRAAGELRDHVDVSLESARSVLREHRATVRDADVAAALDVVIQELTAARGEIADLVAGIPPAQLGEGRLHDALETLVRPSPVPVSVTVALDAMGDTETEATVFYVCSEALTNAVKHAAATTVTIAVRREEGAIVASITDDGRGGADPTGSGLQGLADRLAARNGRLRVETAPGAGTTVTATIPD